MVDVPAIYADDVSLTLTALQYIFEAVVYISVSTKVWTVVALATVGMPVIMTLKFAAGTWSE